MAVAETKKKKFGLIGGAKATASAYTRIDGLSPEAMQSIVDQAYTDFLERLAAAGIELEADTYNKIVSQEETQYVKFNEGPVKDYSYYRAFNNQLHDITVAPTGMEVIKAQQNNLGLVAEEFDLTLLNVEYLLHFGYFDTETQVTPGTAVSGDKAEARVNFGQGLQVYWHSGMAVINGHENAFKKPNGKLLVDKNFYSTTPYGHTTKDSASGGKKGLLGAFNAGLKGGERYVITVVEEEYVATALAVLKEVNEVLVQELAAQAKS